MITDKDIEKLKQVFATKDDLKGLASKDDLMKFKDEMVGRLDTIDQELAVTNYGDQLEDHEIRIEKLEKKLHQS